MIIENCYLIFRNDFKHQTWIDWIKNHITLAPPPHRFVGEISINNDQIVFEGIDNYEDKNSKIVIDKFSINQIYHGYDEDFNNFQTRGFGMSYAPIRLKIENDEYIYIVANFNGVFSANQELFQILKKWLQ